ncbi:sugar ABC transporter permease [Clostridium sp. AF18-27]|uniref:Oligogalacturonide transport system permease protein n=1 Tax=Enterocloster lavalensis TaxID=460384 RepID=A0A1I0IEF8_9FIRM|nr:MULTISPECIES: sugar ABC transporter permease [Enterocloster]MBS5603583.1 sugar ABC transporter permease [Enterocloster asparagiformis]RHR47897.1 sugar ABC transporter permease [Clostridium sp. AF18-27]MDR3757892.1 sugar ABC transporter permease [Enterocloster sp.]PST34440.1 sugar ABC transporter permease [Enterocloster lavalensis]SET94366.1 oligogalacturonide transport system permease protein [Enterocloster lavalensis]
MISNKMKSKRYVGLLYIAPWLLGFLIFQLYPFIASFCYSFTDYTLLNQPQFVGLKNYLTLFTTDKQFLSTMKITGFYALLSVPLKLAFALFIAILLNAKIKGIGIYRSLYYLPSILGGSVAVSVLWRVIFMKDGMINHFIGLLGLGPVNWLTDAKLALITLSLLQVWQFGSAMVIFLAALKGIPAELYEAASIDGSGKWNQFLHITLPQISSVVFFNLIMQSIQALQNFTSAFVITGGGPMKRTYIIGMKLYDDAFRFYKVGYACAESWILFLVILALTLLVFKSSDAWVYYADEGGSKK